VAVVRHWEFKGGLCIGSLKAATLMVCVIRGNNAQVKKLKNTRLVCRSDLPLAIAQELYELLLRLAVPQIILRLKAYVLTPEESRLVGDAGIGRPAPPKEWVSARKIAEIVARQRGFTLERALLELGRSVDFLSTGKYEQLRKVIGEPVVAMRPGIPEWDAASGELRYKGSVVRRLAATATNCRLLLDAFQEDGWPGRIDSPLSADKSSRSLRETVRNLNKALSLLKFYCDGTGEGIIWQEA
jgi:hypothetical protein